MKIIRRLTLSAILVASGYCIAKHEEPVRAVAVGLYEKTCDVVKAPLYKLYDWATDKHEKPGGLENNLQNYQK